MADIARENVSGLVRSSFQAHPNGGNTSSISNNNININNNNNSSNNNSNNNTIQRTYISIIDQTTPNISNGSKNIHTPVMNSTHLNINTISNSRNSNNTRHINRGNSTNNIPSGKTQNQLSQSKLLGSDTYVLSQKRLNASSYDYSGDSLIKRIHHDSGVLSNSTTGAIVPSSIPSTVVQSIHHQHQQQQLGNSSSGTRENTPLLTPGIASSVTASSVLPSITRTLSKNCIPSYNSNIININSINENNNINYKSNQTNDINQIHQIHQIQKQPNIIMNGTNSINNITDQPESGNINSYSNNLGTNDNNMNTGNSDNSSINNNNINNNNINNNGNNNGNSNSGNNNNNNNNNNGNGNTIDSINSPSKASTRQLVQKLQSIYKLIIKQENILQEKCSKLTKTQGTDLEALWSIYRINTYLVENYIDFLTTALSEAQLPQDLMIGKEIVEIYRIERRLWVYGCITFLDVLKNFISNFVDPQIWSQFITNVFISISEMLIELPESYRIPWYERLGDLSRMAIALYPRGFIDWKLSSEYWYNKAIMYNYGHGKLYYHMSTVEQNTLSAYCNLGKSVFCKDMFIPSQHYMQLVIDNIYQRAYSEFQNSENSLPSLDNSNNINTINPNGGPMNNYSEQLATNHHFQHHIYMSHLVEYLKHVEVISMPSFQSNPELQTVVLNYFENLFGIWLKTTTSLLPLENSDFFNEKYVFLQEGEKIKFYFRCSSLFAQSHILQLVGFGNPKNPFAILFDLPLRLKEKKDKRDKKKATSSTSTNNAQNEGSSNNTANNDASSNLGSTDQQMMNETASNMDMDETDQETQFSYEHHEDETPEAFFNNLDMFNLPYKLPENMDIWNFSLKFLNETSIKCSMIVLKKYLKGPLVCSLPHLLPWCYFLIALGKKIELLPTADLQQFWIKLIRTIFPWNTIINCLNKLILFSLKNCPLKYTDQYSNFLDMDFDALVDYYNNEEILPEVWQCWGTLWFDAICEKDIVPLSDNVEQFGLKNYGSISDLSNYGLDFEPKDENGELFWYRSIRLLSLFHGISKKYNHIFGLNTLTTPHGKIGKYLFTFKEPQLHEQNNDMNSAFFNNLQEGIEEHNTNDDIASIINYYNQNVVKLAGSKGFIVDLKDFTLNGDRITGCIYTSGMLEKLNIQGADDYSITTYHNNKRLNAEGLERGEYMESIELELFRNFVKERRLNLTDSFFILDATSWLRHSARVYKMAMNGIVKLSICLTTFQELRFLRKSKDNTVSDAATRAVIILRCLYDCNKILPLRFTGNVATSIEEHLEFEEKMTWKTHVDEFVIDAIFKSQNRLIENYSDALIFLVSDDSNMRMKAINHKITSIGSRFMFILCNELRPNKTISTN